MLKNIVFIVALLDLAACSGLRTTENTYSAHAESFNIFFMQIPSDDTQKRAMELVPKGGEIKTVNSSPKDITSFIGFMNRLLGFDFTYINGTTKKE